MPNGQGNSITEVVIHMYKMGTGDCFVLKFMAGEKESFKMLIDCGRHCFGCKHGDITPFIETLVDDIDNHVDLLVVTHEHTDHVVGFEAAKNIFTDKTRFKADQIWMAWSEEDGAPEIDAWKKDYGKKKANLALAAEQLRKAVYQSPEFKAQLEGAPQAKETLALRQNFSDVLTQFSNLHVGEKQYVGGLPGMDIVKKQIADGNILYKKPGEVLENLPGLPGVRIYVLGPPEVWKQIKMEDGKGDEVYEHNDKLAESDLFFQAVEALDNSENAENLCPFDKIYYAENDDKKTHYEAKGEEWRRIDFDWLFSAGAYALRLTQGINNLSLVLAFEFIESGKVILFPGDAEIGSWKSWQDIKWKEKGFDITTNDLLRKVVFYKVAHHLSHNGTARSIGLDQMTSPDLAAMATLDYNAIDKGWTSTMPNRQIVKELLEKTKGRLMIMNEKGLFYDTKNTIPLTKKIKEVRKQMNAKDKKAFNEAYDDKKSKHFLEYIVKVK